MMATECARCRSTRDVKVIKQPPKWPLCGACRRAYEKK